MLTPIIAKTAAGSEPEGAPSAYYVVASNGLFLCRRTQFFASAVPASAWPAELEPQEVHFEARFPPIPRELFERVVGFFAAVGTAYGAEAAVLLYWDGAQRRVRAIVPEQVATITRGSGSRGHPIGLRYEIPLGLPEAWLQFGDVHSHVDLPAFASDTDVHDELFRPGLHVVVGKIQHDPPQVHVEAVVDGQRFPLSPQQVIEGFRARSLRFPRRWLRRVKIEPTPAPRERRDRSPDSAYWSTSPWTQPERSRDSGPSSRNGGAA